jgi:hypothetical protein
MGEILSMVSYKGRNDPALILSWAYSVVRTQCLETSDRSDAFIAPSCCCCQSPFIAIIISTSFAAIRAIRVSFLAIIIFIVVTGKG